MATFSEEEFTPRMQNGETQKKVRLVGYELEVKRFDQEESDWIQNAISNVEGFAAYGSDGDDIEVVTDPISTSLLVDNSYIGTIANLLAEKCEPCFGGGTHINVSMLPSDSKYTYENLLWMQMIYEGQLQKIFGRISSWAKSPTSCMFRNCTRRFDKKKLVASPLMKGLFNLNFNDEKTSEEFSRMNNKALLITNKTNRYEFRGGKSSVDELELLAWGEFCVNFTEAAAKNKLGRTKFSDFIKGPHIEKYFNEVVQENKERKLKEAELKETLHSTKKLTITDRRSKLL